ncbi:F-box protein At5g49610 [Arabidopsis lyrata subsp. lyrata]|uniref:F-box protein At5g49610 n=1 Tax=Arabidopsis lyrata subsp. lyrata TaxID=81972 RepID=UPI000A29E0A5|nr:F-box protein At5g49610 [Arabidopsis lyrata subsp. lyrata]|eukprot:XP_020874159.1 F-box protein At5g49610 [Arabidopsis lyrata subsp. lyrata]
MMRNSPMNDDVMLEIMSYCPATEMAKFRLLNKECNKRSYEMSFLNRHLHRTNSFLGYIFYYKDNHWFRNHSCFVSGVDEKEIYRINLAYLPPRCNPSIEACDTYHGILLCVDDVYKGRKRIPDYIVCKPATKQYRIIPNPKTRFGTVATGLMVISYNPFRYKIIRVSDTGATVSRDGVYNLSCEVYDSDSDAWKRLNHLVSSEFSHRPVKPAVSAYGCVHWLTEKNNVMRFCMRTETWSIFPVPDDVTSDYYNVMLVNYEGKLGVIHSSRCGKGSNIWVLEKSFGTSWVKVKDMKIAALEDDCYNSQPIWFPSNDTVSRSSSGRLSLYNMSNNKYRFLHTKQDFYPSHWPAGKYFVPFYSNYERVCFNKNDVEGKERSERGTRDGTIEKKKEYDHVVIMLLFSSLFFISPTL